MGERRCHFIFIPFSRNGIHLLAQFSAKEVINSVASSLRLQGREGKCSAGAPRGGGLASAYNCLTGNDRGNRKRSPVSFIVVGAGRKGPSGTDNRIY